MNNMLDIIAQFQNVPTCIVGDFNEDVSITLNTHCCTMFRLQGFKQMISKPTHDSGTIMDHLYVSHTLNTIQTDVTDCYYSDHDYILCVKSTNNVHLPEADRVVVVVSLKSAFPMVNNDQDPTL